MILTTDSLEGHHIRSYHGYAFAVTQNLNETVQGLERLALDYGGNALVGVSFGITQGGVQGSASYYAYGTVVDMD